MQGDGLLIKLQGRPRVHFQSITKPLLRTGILLQWQIPGVTEHSLTGPPARPPATKPEEAAKEDVGALGSRHLQGLRLVCDIGTWLSLPFRLFETLPSCMSMHFLNTPEQCKGDSDCYQSP